MERSLQEISDEPTPELLALVTPIEEPFTSTEPYDPDSFERGVSREAAFNKIVIDDIERDKTSIEELYTFYRETLPWADDVLVKILANQHFDRALVLAREIEADPEHEFHQKKS